MTCFQENTALIKEINELRREIRSLKAKAAGGTFASKRVANPSDSTMLSEDLKREMEMQRDLISRLREDTAAKEARIRQLESMVAPRPISRERLPAMEGFPGSAPPLIPQLHVAGVDNDIEAMA